MLARWVLLLQSVAELEQNILMQSEPVVELGPHSSDKFGGLSKEKSKNLLLLSVAGLVFGSSVQHFVTQLMLKYFLQLGSVVHLELCSQQHWLCAGC